MGRFISQEAVPVHTPDDEENVIYIKPRMDVGTMALVRSAMISIQMQANVTTAMPSNAALSIDVGAYNVALLVHNIVRWSGPDFNGVLCITENIKKLDPDDPLLALVLQEINNRNLTKVASPNSSNGTGTNGLTPSTGQKKQAASHKAT